VALQTSGPISFSDINQELGNSSTDTLNLNSSDIRNLTPNSTYADALHGVGINTASGTIISMSELYGASAESITFSFSNIINADRGIYYSRSSVVTGIVGSVSATAGSGDQVSLNGSTWSSSVTVTNGATLYLRTLSSSSFNTSTTASATINGVTESFTITTEAEDSIPDNFSFTSVTNAALSTYYSRSTTITGINTSVTATAGSGDQVSLNGSTWSSSVTVTDGATLYLRTLSSSSFNTSTTASVDVGGVVRSFTITTEAADTTPDNFSFSDFTNAALSTYYSRSTTITGINTSVTATAGSGDQVSLNGSTWSSSVTVTNGATLYLRTLSSSSFNTSTTASANVGGVTGSFTITTEAADTTPDNFTFSNVTNASLSTYYSRSTTITGINGPVTATAGSGDQVSLNGSTWSSSVTVTDGATLYLRTLSSSSFNTSTTASATINGVTGSFTITTREASATLTPSSTTLSIFDDVTPFSGYAGIQLHETGGVSTFSLGTLIDGFPGPGTSDNQWTSDPRSAFQARATITSGTPSSAVSFTDQGTGTSLGTWIDVTGTNYLWVWGATSETSSTFTVKLEIRAKGSQTILTSSLITLNFELVDIPA